MPFMLTLTYAEWHIKALYAACRYAECWGAVLLIVTLMRLHSSQMLYMAQNRCWGYSSLISWCVSDEQMYERYWHPHTQYILITFVLYKLRQEREREEREIKKFEIERREERKDYIKIYKKLEKQGNRYREKKRIIEIGTQGMRKNGRDKERHRETQAKEIVGEKDR